jgi:hypothetical protein
MMHERGKSDEAIVAGKPANKAERSAAEQVERRAEAKGNAGQQRTLWTPCQAQRATGAGRMRTIASAMERLDPRWEPLRESCTYGFARGRGAILIPCTTSSRQATLHNDRLCVIFDSTSARTPGLGLVS